jgi:hypothetical protein
MHALARRAFFMYIFWDHGSRRVLEVLEDDHSDSARR